MRDNPLQFAVVREDPRVEQALIEATGASRVLLVASGGCTALTLRATHPEVALRLFDFNPAQLAHVRAKQAARHADAPVFNVGNANPDGLNAAGNFESLFAGLRRFVEDFCVPPEELTTAFEEESKLAGTVARLTEHRYWPVAFSLFLSDPLLNTMFGPAATQHAAPGSYPGYFQRAFERGLRRPDAFNNYFLHHLLLGRYVERPAAWPDYLQHPASGAPLDLVEGALEEVPDLDGFDLIALSNLPDWMNDAEITALATTLENTRPGAHVLFRQLNNDRDLGAALGPRWTPRPMLAAELFERDRSLFYDRLLVYRRDS
ncbi:MAG: DUF3419 family protein [Sandaracinaceae bacterium]